jgi:hypothetical protein
MIRSMARPGVTLRKYKMGEEPEFDEEVLRMTPGERMALTWEISKALWMWQSGSDDEPAFRRDVVRVIRRGR